MSNPITWDDIELFIRKPHVFGHYLGYSDLIELHSEWIKDAWIRKDKKAMQAHRNSYKTTAILIVGALWYHLFYDPNATILFLRKADSDAQKIVKTVTDMCLTKEVIYISQFLYNTNELKTETWSKTSAQTTLKTSPTPEGNFEAKGVTSNMTGGHYDFIFPDDIVSIKDRISKTEREATKNVIRELKNIVKKPHGQIYYSGTPWHEDDAWTICPKPDVYPVGTIDIPGFTKKELPATMKELRQGNTESLVSANYYLKHITDEGRTFDEPVYTPWPEKSKIKKCVAYLDPSYKGDNNTALAMAAQTIDKTIIRGWVWEKNVVDLYGIIVNILKDYGCGTMFVESNADKGLSVIEFRKKWPSVVERHEKENKHIRILNYVKAGWDALHFADDCQPEYLSQVLDYQEGEEPDDAPDALAGLCRELKIGGNKLLNRYG